MTREPDENFSATDHTIISVLGPAWSIPETGHLDIAAFARRHPALVEHRSGNSDEYRLTEEGARVQASMIDSDQSRGV